MLLDNARAAAPAHSVKGGTELSLRDHLEALAGHALPLDLDHPDVELDIPDSAHTRALLQALALRPQQR